MTRPYAPVKPMPFVHLMKVLTAHYGTKTRAMRETGLSEQSYNKLMHEQRVSRFVAAKILAHYRLVRGS